LSLREWIDRPRVLNAELNLRLDVPEIPPEALVWSTLRLDLEALMSMSDLVHRVRTSQVMSSLSEYDQAQKVHPFFANCFFPSLKGSE
jgi:hypothetical protein